MRLSTNFSSIEIFKAKWKDVPKPQQHMAKMLVEYVLQPIRTDLGFEMDISDADRNEADVKSLLRQGYNPSMTTDHFFGKPQKIPPTTLKNRAKIKKFGPMYSYSVGAVDYFPRGKNTDKEFMLKHFKRIVWMAQEILIFPGQIILEKGKNTWWIHISLDALCVYSDMFVKSMGLQKNKYLISNNNGRSYTIYNP